MLTQHADNLWSASCDHGFMGLQFGARMTIVGMGDADGSIILHSPIAMSDALVDEIKNLGNVVAVIAPNLFHHVYVADALKHFPDAKLVAPKALGKKRKDLTVDVAIETLVASSGEASENSKPIVDDTPWDVDALIPFAVDGQKVMRETVFLHVESRSLITTDLVLNIEQPKGAMTRFYSWAASYKGVPLHSPLLKMTTWNDKAEGKASLERILALDFDRLVLAHGSIVETGGREALAAAFQWLLKR